MREDADGSRYYFIYNNSAEDIVATVQLAGTGDAYILNAWDGTVTPAAGCVKSDEGIQTTLYMDGYDATIVAISADAEAFPAAIANPIVATNGEAVNVDGEAAVRVRESGAVTAEYADGTTVEQEVTVPEASSIAVSYTHLDVYKRQGLEWSMRSLNFSGEAKRILQVQPSLPSVMRQPSRVKWKVQQGPPFTSRQSDTGFFSPARISFALPSSAQRSSSVPSTPYIFT